MAIEQHSFPVSARVEGCPGESVSTQYDGVIVERRTAESVDTPVSPVTSCQICCIAVPRRKRFVSREQTDATAVKKGQHGS